MKSSLVDIDFFEKLFIEYLKAKNSLTDFNDSNYSAISKFFLNFFNFNNIYLFNISKTDFESLILNKNYQLNVFFIHFLVDKVNSGVCKIEFVKHLDKIKLRSNTLSSYIGSLNHEYFIFNKENLYSDFRTLQEEKVFQIDRNKQFTFPQKWKFLYDYNFVTNSFIIFDRYLNLSKDYLIFNLFEILSSLNINKNFIFQISIFKVIPKSNNSVVVNQQINELLNSYDVIIDFLKNNLNLKLFEIEIAYYNTNNNSTKNLQIPHSREILSNYFRLVSDHSFNYFDQNNRLTVSCKLDLIPILSGNYAHYLTKLSEIKEFKNREEVVFVRDLRIKNRLFDLIS